MNKILNWIKSFFIENKTEKEVGVPEAECKKHITQVEIEPSKETKVSTSGPKKISTNVVTSVSGGQWYNRLGKNFTNTTVRSTFKVTCPKQNSNLVIGFSNKECSKYSDMICLVRFKDDKVNAFNKNRYKARNKLKYVSGQTMSVVVEMDLVSNRYDVLVDGVIIGKGFAFRSKTNSLSIFSAKTMVHDIEIRDLKMSSVAKRISPQDIAPAGQINNNRSKTTNRRSRRAK